jgi:hypothetical protein
MDYSKVIDHDYLVRDNSTGAIINIDKSVFESTKKSRLGAETIGNLQSDVELLKNELYEIKNLLRELISNGNT